MVDVKACEAGGGLFVAVSAGRAVRAVERLQQRSQPPIAVKLAVLGGVANAARQRRAADACAGACGASVGVGQRGFDAVGRERAVVCVASAVAQAASRQVSDAVVLVSDVEASADIRPAGVGRILVP